MTLDAQPHSRLDRAPHATGTSLDAIPLTCRRMRWHAAWTEHHRERIAADAIRSAGFEAFLPLYLDKRPGYRFEIVPAFPRYVLCRFDASRTDWSAITRARGVAGLIRHAPGCPTPLPDSAVDELLARTSDRGVIDDPGEAHQMPVHGVPSEWLRLSDLDAGGRVRLLYRLFGASVARVAEAEAA